MLIAKKNVLATLAMTALLAGCGGGGGDNNSTTAATSASAKAEGVYSGTTSTGATFNLAVLDDNSFYALAGVSSGGTFFVSSLVQGTATTDGTNISSADAREFGASSVTSGSLTGTYVAGTSIAATIRASSTSTLSGTTAAVAPFVYNTPAVLSQIAGSWSGNLLNGAAATLNISATGAATAFSSGCSITGTVIPRASGKNVFDVVLTTGASPCATPNTSAAGIAISYVLTTGRRQLIVAALPSSRASAITFLAAR